MRSLLVAVSFLALAVVTGCGSGRDAMRPSAEMTGSIKRSAAAEPDAGFARPDADLGEEVSDQPFETAAIPEQRPDVPTPVLALATPERPDFRAMPPERAVRKAAMDGSTIHRRRFRDAKPINFGKSNPRALPVHGVDVSRWQGEIDWAKLRSQGANFAYIKATDGGDHLDPMFRKNWRAAEAAGLKRGAYHFFYWCRTAGEQADWFIRNVPRVEGALPPVIDVEWNGESRCRKRPSRAKVLEKMQVFMDKLEAHYGQRPIIYTAPDFYADNLKGQFLDYPFWLRSVAAHPSKRYPGRKWVFWQYSGSGLSHGVRGKIDLNAFNGSEQQWRRWVAGRTLVADAD